MLEPRYDHVRDAIRNVPRDGFFAVAKKGDPNSCSVSLTYDFASDAAARAELTWLLSVAISSSLT